MHARGLLAIALLLAGAPARPEGPPGAPAAGTPGTPARPSAAGARPGALKMLCEGEEFVFAGACTGRFEGVIGLAIFDHRGAAWSEADDWMLEQYGLANVTDKKANYAPRSSWTGFVCRSKSGVLLDLKGILPKNFLYEIPMDACTGDAGPNENFALKELEVYVTPDGARVGELKGVFEGHPDNSVSQGSFHEALVRRFGEKNCSKGNGAQFCREGSRSRIEVTQMPGQPSLFWVRIKTPGVREQATAYAARKISEARNAAPVNDF